MSQFKYRQLLEAMSLDDMMENLGCTIQGSGKKYDQLVLLSDSKGTSDTQHGKETEASAHVCSSTSVDSHLRGGRRNTSGSAGTSHGRCHHHV